MSPVMVRNRVQRSLDSVVGFFPTAPVRIIPELGDVKRDAARRGHCAARSGGMVEACRPGGYETGAEQHADQQPAAKPKELGQLGEVNRNASGPPFRAQALELLFWVRHVAAQLVQAHPRSVQCTERKSEETCK